MSMEIGNKNFLIPNRFRFEIARAPNVTFNIVEAEIPGVSAMAAQTPSPRLNIPKHADHATFDNFSITFKLTEDLSNYVELFDWMTKSAAIKSMSQHAELRNAPIGDKETLYSDLTLTIISSAQNPIAEITFRNAFPIALSPINFNTGDSNELNCTVTFSYILFDIKAIS